MLGPFLFGGAAFLLLKVEASGKSDHFTIASQRGYSPAYSSLFSFASRSAVIFLCASTSHSNSQLLM